MKKIVLLTNNFPYSLGEDTFIIPELTELKKYFDIDIIRTSTNPIIEGHIDKFDLTKCKVSYYQRPRISMGTKIRNLLACLFFKEYYKNIFSSKCSLKNFLIRESECRNFYLDAKLFYQYLVKNGYLDEDKIKDTIYYSYWSNSMFMSLCLAKAKRKKMKIVCRAANYDLFNWRMKGNLQPYKKYMDKQLDKFYHVSNMGFKYYLDNFANKKSSNKYELSYLGVKDYGINKYQNRKDLTIVSCSYITSVKRVNLIIDELSRIKDIQINWIHFGGGELLEEMQEYAKEKLPTNVSYCFKGNTDNQDIIHYYQNNFVDLFILLSHSEGLPVCIMEALSFGIPTIATNAGGVGEAINNNNGILLPVDFISGEVAKYIIKYFNYNDKQITQLRRNARQTYLDMFSADKNFNNFAKSLLNLFDERN